MEIWAQRICWFKVRIGMDSRGIRPVLKTRLDDIVANGDGIGREKCRGPSCIHLIIYLFFFSPGEIERTTASTGGGLVSVGRFFEAGEGSLNYVG